MSSAPRVTRGSAAAAEDAASLSARERLLFAQAVYTVGSKAWPEVSKHLSRHPMISRPKNFFSAQSCPLIYTELMNQAQLERNAESDGIHAPIHLKLAQIYYREHCIELQELIAAEEAKFKTLAAEIDDIRAGRWDDKIIKSFLSAGHNPIGNDTVERASMTKVSLSQPAVTKESNSGGDASATLVPEENEPDITHAEDVKSETSQNLDEFPSPKADNTLPQPIEVQESGDEILQDQPEESATMDDTPEVMEEQDEEQDEEQEQEMPVNETAADVIPIVSRQRRSKRNETQEVKSLSEDASPTSPRSQQKGRSREKPRSKSSQKGSRRSEKPDDGTETKPKTRARSKSIASIHSTPDSNVEGEGIEDVEIDVIGTPEPFGDDFTKRDRMS